MKTRKTLHKSSPELRVTLQRGAEEFGVSVETLRRHLRAAGEDTRRGSTFTLRVIFKALMAGGRDSRNRRARADAERKEIELQQLKAGLVDVAKIELRITKMMTLCRERFAALPAEACARCNPSDPELAKRALAEWTAEAQATIPKGITR